MKNKMEDLRNHLFDQLDRLSKPECDIEKESQRASVIIQVASTVIETGRLEIEFMNTIKNEGMVKSDFFPNIKERPKYFIERESDENG